MVISLLMAAAYRTDGRKTLSLVSLQNYPLTHTAEKYRTRKKRTLHSSNAAFLTSYPFLCFPAVRPLPAALPLPTASPLPRPPLLSPPLPPRLPIVAL